MVSKLFSCSIYIIDFYFNCAGFQMIIKIKNKHTKRTWWFIPEFNLCILTGHRIFIEPGKAGYSEINDRGEPVLDSWIYQEPLVRLVG